MSRKFRTILVEGDSMLPTYASGDWLMAKWDGFVLKSEGSSIGDLLRNLLGLILGDRLKVGDVVVIERLEQPGIFYVKRITAVKPADYQIFVSSDNPEGTDSRQWGWLPVVSVRAKVTSRVRRAKK